MKSLMPWVCLVAVGAPHLVWADGLDAYRLGQYEKAAQEFDKTSSQDAMVQYYQARMRLYGYGQLRNEAIALRHYDAAANKGLLPAQQFMAAFSLLSKKDPVLALNWYKKAANSGDLQAKMFCAAAYLYGLGTPKNPDIAKRYYIDAAKSGDAIAQYTLAEDFINSRQASNKKLGLIWLNKSVSQNNPQAQLMLGGLYLSGNLVTKNEAQGLDLINQSARLGHMPALVKLGELALAKKDFSTAKTYFEKAVAASYVPAEVALAELYFTKDTPFNDNHAGFLWLLKAAQVGNTKAQIALSKMYQEGVIVGKDSALSDEWARLAKNSEKQNNAPLRLAALWLSNGLDEGFARSGYALKGILSPWQNAHALQDNNYNAAPKRDKLSRKRIFSPEFTLRDPKTIAISDYYDLLVNLTVNSDDSQWDFARYPLVGPLATLELQQTSVTLPKEALSDKVLPSQLVSVKPVKEDSSRIANDILRQAVLGESNSQFMAGQMYQYGIGVAADAALAIKFYNLAATLQDERAEYALAVMYLTGKAGAIDIKQGLSLMADAAFKGDAYAQYALARIYEHGYGPLGDKKSISRDPEQSMAMYYLAAASNYGPAQYRLAQKIAKDQSGEQSIGAKQARTELIKRLYEGAHHNGEPAAAVPLAYFNAMAASKDKQAQAFSIAKQAAQAGDAQAALLMGIMYDRGISVAPNQGEALYWYQQAAHNPASAFILGSYAALGVGGAKDFEKAQTLLTQAADAHFSYGLLNLAILNHEVGSAFVSTLEKAYSLGNTEAGLLLADHILTSASNEASMTQARDVYTALALRGDKDAELKIAYLLDNGLGGKAAPLDALKWYQASAKQGQVMAQYLLGQFYELGRETGQPDYVEAKHWYSEAQSSYAPAAVALGFVYDTVDDDYALAQKAYEKAALMGDANASYNLGLIYEEGKGLGLDLKKAQSLYLAAANLGKSCAMTQLAGLYLSDETSGRNPAEALHWYKKAADLANDDALYQLGLLSETGIGTKLDFKDAEHYYEQSANKGNEKAMLALARMYQYGLGIGQNTPKAIAIYERLAALNNGYAQYQLAMHLQASEGNSKNVSKLLAQASDNAYGPATQLLERFAAENQGQGSYIASVNIAKLPMIAEQSADWMYLQALSMWNRGDEQASRLILNKIVTRYPQYAPARKVYEQLNQA